MLNEIKKTPYLRGFSLSVDQAFETWRTINSFVLKNHSINNNWIFLNYNEIFDDLTLDKIEDFSGVCIDREFPDINLYRSRSEFTIDSKTAHVYRTLLDLKI